MSSFKPTKANYRKRLLVLFYLKKNASESYRMLVDSYGEYAPSLGTCEYWFKRFKGGDFDTNDKARKGRPGVCKSTEIKALLDENSSQTQKELAKSLGVSQKTVSLHLRYMKKCE